MKKGDCKMQIQNQILRQRQGQRYIISKKMNFFQPHFFKMIFVPPSTGKILELGKGFIFFGCKLNEFLFEGQKGFSALKGVSTFYRDNLCGRKFYMNSCVCLDSHYKIANFKSTPFFIFRQNSKLLSSRIPNTTKICV